MTPLVVVAALVSLALCGYAAAQLVALGPSVDRSGNCWGDGPDWVCDCHRAVYGWQCNQNGGK